MPVEQLSTFQAGQAGEFFRRSYDFALSYYASLWYYCPLNRQ